MQSARKMILRHLRVSLFATQDANALNRLSRQLCTIKSTSHDQIMTQVIGLVKKFDKIDATKVTETADFQKDLCLDSLDRVELVMAFEQEFSIEIPDEKADRLTCCSDVAKYIISEAQQKNMEKP